MDDVTVRAARPGDAPAVQRIAHEGWRATYGDFLSSSTLEHVRNEWHTLETFRELASRDDVDFFVAESDDELVGYASGGVPDPDSEPERGVVGTLYVAPDRWGEGVGSAVFERLLDALRDRGARRVEIAVFSENGVGRSFYESQGFAVVDEHEDDIAGERHATVTYASGL